LILIELDEFRLGVKDVSFADLEDLLRQAPPRF
jgi:hypothetical protein